MQPNNQQPLITPQPEQNNNPSVQNTDPVINPNTPYTPPSQTTSSNKTLIVGSIVAVLLITVIGLAFFLLKPKKDDKPNTTTNTSTQPAATPETSSNKFANCLNKTELKSLQGDGEYTLKDIEGKYYVYDTFFFLANSTEYEFKDIVNETYSKYKIEFAKISTKDWNISLKGQIKDIDGTGNSPANIKLANDRANKVKNDLVAKSGVPASRITIEEPEIFTSETGPDDSNRNVTFDLETQCSDKQIEL